MIEMTFSKCLEPLFIGDMVESAYYRIITRIDEGTIGYSGLTDVYTKTAPYKLISRDGSIFKASVYKKVYGVKLR